MIIDLEAELTKERAHMEECISELHKALGEEINKMKKEFNTCPPGLHETRLKCTRLIARHTPQPKTLKIITSLTSPTQTSHVTPDNTPFLW
jgi:hypothetical protein